MSVLYSLLAQGRNEEINNWLDENPMVLGLGALVLGGGILAYGLYELQSGVSRDKRGNVVEGGTGKALTIVRLVAGGGVILFGLYKMIAG